MSITLVEAAKQISATEILDDVIASYAKSSHIMGTMPLEGINLSSLNSGYVISSWSVPAPTPETLAARRFADGSSPLIRNNAAPWKLKKNGKPAKGKNRGGHVHLLYPGGYQAKVRAGNAQQMLDAPGCEAELLSAEDEAAFKRLGVRKETWHTALRARSRLSGKKYGATPIQSGEAEKPDAGGTYSVALGNVPDVVTLPHKPTVGESYFDTQDYLVRSWDGSQWVAVQPSRWAVDQGKGRATVQMIGAPYRAAAAPLTITDD